MPTPTMPTLSEAMELLSSSWAALANGVLRGEFAFWLGSGISRERFPNVPALLLEVLNRLHAGVTADPNCPYLKSINEIIALTSVEGLLPTVAPLMWPEAKRRELLQQLQEKYAVVLEQDVRVPGATVWIRWDLLKLDELYGNPAISPDAEHRFVALLIEEGVVSELVTTNWDALVEIAHEKCRAGKPPSFQSVASNNEWSRNGYSSRLIKIHGCARKSCVNSAQYKSFLVATKTDIHTWENDQRFESFRDAIKGILRERTALFVGLSAQDWNIQAVCCSASLGQGVFPTTPQKVYFAEQSITASQRAVLKVLYGETAYNNAADILDAKAIVPLFAKPLLGSLFVLTILEKTKIIQNIDNPEIKPECRTLIDGVAGQTFSLLKSKHDAISNFDLRWRKLAEDLPYFISRLLAIFRRQKPPLTEDAYEAVGNDHLKEMADNAHDLQDLQWLLFALSVMQEGTNRGLWRIGLPAGKEPKEGQLNLVKGGVNVPIFLLQNDAGLASLINDGFVDPSAPHKYLMIYPGERQSANRRATSPTRALPGRGTSKCANEICMRSELEDAGTLSELFANLNLRMAVTIPT
jgi:hypothetical protein